MAISEIPAQRVFKCDGCGFEKTEVAGTSRPRYWANFHVLRDAYDFQGAACADASVKLILCNECADTAAKAVNTAIAQRRTAKEPA